MILKTHSLGALISLKSFIRCLKVVVMFVLCLAYYLKRVKTLIYSFASKGQGGGGLPSIKKGGVA